MTTEKHHLQKFETRRIQRSQISAAPYNPRKIEDDSRRRLSQNLRSKGLLDTLVWNEQTGNLVSGHQRLEILDKEWHKKHNNYDYSLDVSVVNLSLKDEMEQNIFFNNARAMGTFDDDKMIELFNNPDFPEIDPKAAGMIEDDISYFSIQLDLQNAPTNESVESIMDDFEKVKEEKKQAISPEEYEKRKAAVKDIKKEITKNEIDTTVTLTFSNQSAKRAFMEMIGETPENLFIKGEMFVEKFFNKNI